MSNIPSLASYIAIEATEYRAAASESTMQAIGGSINYILDHLAAAGIFSTTYTSNGTFVVPSNISKVFVFGKGGGGGGGGNAGSGYTPDPNYAALISTLAGGGGASEFICKLVAVTPGASLAVTIGAGGVGGSVGAPGNPGSTGNPGGTTSLGSVAIFPGQQGGQGGGSLSQLISGFGTYGHNRNLGGGAAGGTSSDSIGFGNGGSGGSPGANGQQGALVVAYVVV